MNYTAPTPPESPHPSINGMTLPLKNAKIIGSASVNGDTILTIETLNKTWMEWEEALIEKIQSIVRGGPAIPMTPQLSVNDEHQKIMVVIREVHDVNVFGAEDGTVSVFDPEGLTFPDGTPCLRSHVKMVGFDRDTIKARFHTKVAYTHSPGDYSYAFGEFRANIVGVSGGYARAEFYTRYAYEQYDFLVENIGRDDYGEPLPPTLTRIWNFQDAEFEEYQYDENFPKYYFPLQWVAQYSRIPEVDKPKWLKSPATFRAFEQPDDRGPGPGYPSLAGQPGYRLPITLETHLYPLICWALLVNE